MKIVIATIKSWNIKNVKSMCIDGVEIYLIEDKDRLTKQFIDEISPEYVFFIHWSWYISKEIYENYRCIVFHPAKVPFGRGGSPIQNLIERGYTDTTISAISVGEELDAGDVYPVSCELNLNGTADEILMRMSKKVCFYMIPKIIKENPVPVRQDGEIVTFSRRKPKDSAIDFSNDIEKIYDLIRMLDGEGYPKAYVDIGKYRLEFNRAALHTDSIVADVKIERKENE